MKKTTFLAFITLLLFNSVNAQILYDENFDNFQLGNLSNDPTGITSGQGGWHVDLPTNDINIQVINETSRGKVIGFGWSNSKPDVNSAKIFLKDLYTLWDTRVKSNNIFKIEYEMFIENTNVPASYLSFNVGTTATDQKYICQLFSTKINNKLNIGWGGAYIGETTAYNYSWIKIEIFHDFKNLKTYYHIPSLNYLSIEEYIVNPGTMVDNIYMILYLNNIGYSNALVKIDNFKLSAISTLPKFLGVTDYISEKFNLYPNPATSIVNIRNNENIIVKHVEIYDVAGKLVNTQFFDNEAEVQLNIETLSSGKYMLHIETDQGTAMKKLIKK